MLIALLMKLLFLLSMLFSLNGYCLTKTEATDLSKSRILGLAPLFAQLANNCYIFEEDCGITGNSQVATVKWFSWEFREHRPDIKFDSGREKFLIDGAVRIAKTGSRHGAPVIFNLDLLAKEEASGQYSGLDFWEVFGVLVHEFGHHQEELLRQVGLKPLDHYELDLIAVKIVSYLKDRTRRTRISADEVPGLGAEAGLDIYQTDIEWFNGVRNIWSNIIVDSRLGMREVSAETVQNLQCPIERREGHIVFKGEPAYAAFRRVSAPILKFLDQKLTLEQEVGEASVLCIDRTMGVFQVFDKYTHGHFSMEFSLKNGFLNLDRSSFTAQMPGGNNQ